MTAKKDCATTFILTKEDYNKLKEASAKKRISMASFIRSIALEKAEEILSS